MDKIKDKLDIYNNLEKINELDCMAYTSIKLYIKLLEEENDDFKKALNEIEEYINDISWEKDNHLYSLTNTTMGKDILKIIDKVGDRK